MGVDYSAVLFFGYPEPDEGLDIVKERVQELLEDDSEYLDEERFADALADFGAVSTIAYGCSYSETSTGLALASYSVDVFRTQRVELPTIPESDIALLKRAAEHLRWPVTGEPCWYLTGYIW